LTNARLTPAALLALAIACDRDPSPSPVVQSARDAAAIAPALVKPVTALGAFDLSQHGDGALLVWADETAARRGVYALRLDARGKPRAAPVRAGATDSGVRAIEVVAAGGPELTAIGWVGWNGRKAETFAVSGDAAAGSFGAPIALGEPSISSVARRGRVALAARRSGGPLAFFRGAEQACADHAALDPCTSFGFRALEATGPLSRGFPLSVPGACDTGISGLAVVGERWHYGVCVVRGGRRVTTVFSVEPATQYARVDEVLRGCIPLGMARVGEQVIAGGDCDGRWQGARLPGGDHAAEALTGDVTLSCANGAPVLRSGDGKFSLRLSAPIERLEALLPPRRFGPAARAVWTGHRLLVAAWDGTQVSLRAEGCEGDRLIVL
jgi:hypothetical protein